MLSVAESSDKLPNPYQHSCHTSCNGRSEEGGTFYKWSSIWALPPAGWWGSPWFGEEGGMWRILRYLKIERCMGRDLVRLAHVIKSVCPRSTEIISYETNTIIAVFKFLHLVDSKLLRSALKRQMTNPIWQSSFIPSVPQQVQLTDLLLYVCCLVWGGPR